MNQSWLPAVGATLLDRYRLDECIGNGPTGTVFLATDLLSRQRVTVKALHPDLFEARNKETNLRRLVRAKLSTAGTLPGFWMYFWILLPRSPHSW